MRAAQLAELAVGALVTAGLAWGGHATWAFYDRELLPYARVVPTMTPTPYLDPETARQEARRIRRVIDYVGAGMYLRQVGERDAAIRSFEQALELDPTNFEARQNLAELGVAAPTPPPGVVLRTPVPPTATPLPTVTPRP